jgi:hypothetical protein
MMKNLHNSSINQKSQTGKSYPSESNSTVNSFSFSTQNLTTMEKSYNSKGINPSQTELADVQNSNSRKETLSLKRLFNILALALVIFVAGIGSSWGQTQHIIVPTGGTAGNTNGTGSDPICRYYNSIRFQVVYTVAELNAAGLTGSSQITRLAWNVTESSVSLANYTIKMANVTATNSSAHNTTATTTVKNAFTYGIALGYNDIVFDVPFTWNGTSNLLIEICSGTTNPFTSPYGGVQAKTGITAGSRSYRVDAAAACATNTNTTHTTKPYVRLTKAATTACTGTPAPGNTIASPTSVASGSTAALSLQNATAGSGVTYQWQSGPSSTGPWTAFGTSAATQTSPAITSNTWFRCRVTCGANTGNSTPVQVTLAYCTPTSNCAFGTYPNVDVISSVSLNTLSNVTNGTCGVNGYSNYTTNPALTTTLLPSQSYNVTVGVAGYAQSVAVWIDYNDDLVFDNVTERVGATPAGTPIPANSTSSFPITLGCNPPAGVHRMRVRCSDNSFVNGPAQTPCAAYAYGETEDYNITIAAAPACPSPGLMTTITPSFTTVALSWNAGCAAGTSYDFQYGPQGFTIGSGTTVTNQTVSLSGGVASYTLSGLTSNTQYSVYYRANCGGSTSSWSLASNFATLCTPVGDETSYGNDSWIGYVYNSSTPGTFTTYKGTVTESEIFNRLHTTTPVGASTNLCLGTNSDLFAIRYKMTKNFPAGDYIFTIGGDDGVRLSIDGGTTWLINNWVDQGYTTSSNSVPVSLNGSTNLVFEYYDNTSGAQSSFSYALAPVPTCATYTSPANGAAGTVVNPTLTWNAVANATSYDVYIGAGSLPSTPTATVTGTTYAAICDGLTNYIWQVVPKNAQGSATGCATWSFTTMNVDYATAWISANTGDSWWCQGETRSVTVTLKNNGAVSWIDAGSDNYNIGIKWNGEPDYIVRVDAQNLAAGATGTYTFTVTAPTAGNNNLTFDVVKEGAFWFGSNTGGAGPGNVTYSNVANVNNTYPSVSAGTDVSSCVASSTNLSGTSSVSLAGTVLNETFSGAFWTTNDATRWSSVATATAGGTTPEARFTYSTGTNGTIIDANIRSALINASNYTGMTLSFRHMVDWYTGSFNLSAEVSTNGTTWTNVWTQTASADVLATNISGISLASMSGQSFYLRFRFNGNIWNIDNWYIDNVVISGTGSSNITPTWSGPNSYAASGLAPALTSVLPGSNNYIISSTYQGCTSTDVVQITGTGPTTLATTPTSGSVVWRGATSTDWTTASNWYAYDGTNYNVASSIPTASTNVIIAANQGCVAQQPAVALSGTVNANNVTIETGAALTMGNSSILEVAGNFTINGTGTFTPGTGTVNFTGNGTQIVTVGNQAFNNVTISGFGTVQLTGNTTINGNFLNSDGSLDMNNFNLTIGGNYANYNSMSGLNPGTGTVIFNKASGTQTVDQLALDFHHIQHTGAGTVQFVSDISTTGDIINSSGIMDGNDKIITVRNNFTNTATFTPGTQGLGEIYFEKVGGSQTLTPGTSFFHKFAHTGTGTLNLSGIVDVQGDVVIDAPIAAGTSTLKLSGTGPQVMSGTQSMIALKDMTVAKATGTVTLSRPVRVDGILTMTQGDILTDNTNILEVGSGVSSVGSVSWNNANGATVRGPMKRWFAAATNSNQATGIFPVGATIPGKGVINRYAQVNFTSTPGAGGYIVAEYKTGLSSTGSAGLPITYNSNQYIQNFEEEGYWDITPYNEFGTEYAALNTAPYTLKLRMNNPSTLQPGTPPSGSNGNVIADISKLRIISSKGPDHSSWVLAGTPGAGQSVLASGDFLLEETGVTGFSFFNGGGNDNNPLPVELVSFTGACDNGVISLTWQTASEFNSSHFDVEKSRDGENWQLLSKIASAGTSNELISYQTADHNAIDGNNYFRLRQVDIDGTEKVYDPINVSCAEVTTGYFSSFPNPSGSAFQVLVNNKELIGVCILNMVDATGKVIEQREIEVKDGINMFVVNQELTPGIYFLNISNGSKSTQVLRHAIK